MVDTFVLFVAVVNVGKILFIFYPQNHTLIRSFFRGVFPEYHKKKKKCILQSSKTMVDTIVFYGRC